MLRKGKRIEKHDAKWIYRMRLAKNIKLQSYIFLQEVVPENDIKAAKMF